MAEYIKREADVKAVEKYGLTNGVVWGRHTGLAICIASEIADIPAADVAPVVRCMDCKHYRNHPNGLCYLHTEAKANARGYSGDAVCVEPDDFCSFGEPKENANADNHD